MATPIHAFSHHANIKVEMYLKPALLSYIFHYSGQHSEESFYHILCQCPRMKFFSSAWFKLTDISRASEGFWL
jgi:hypothetical protein